MSTERARDLRKRMTPPEKRMWNMLRQEPLEALHFRRQVPLGHYYADFASHEARLVIEIDGATHATDEAISCDATRTTFLQSQGYRVVRFTNVEIMNHLDGVFEVIMDAATPTRLGFADPPSPQGGGRTALPEHP